MGCKRLTYYQYRERALGENLFFLKGGLEKRYADEKKRIDYYPFGSQMVGRSFSSNQYRYGFNGYEKDDEVKGSGNSLDFGARIYDSRLGRWLTVDPQFRKQPGWTPYKAFLDNPIFYVDPAGETEYSTVIRINKKTGKTTLEVAKFNRIMTDGEIKSKKTLLGGSYWEVDYYDYNSLTIITTNKNGKETTTTRKEIIKENGVKDSDSFNRGDNGDTKVDWGIDISRSGINFTLSSGKGEGRRTASYDVETVDLDLLLAAFGATRSASGSRGIKNLFEVYTRILKTIKITENIKNATKGDASSNRKVSSSSVEVHICPTCDSPIKDTTEHNEKLGRKKAPGKGYKKVTKTDNN